MSVLPHLSGSPHSTAPVSRRLVDPTATHILTFDRLRRLTMWFTVLKFRTVMCYDEICRKWIEFALADVKYGSIHKTNTFFSS